MSDDYSKFLAIAPDSWVTEIIIHSKHISGNEWTWNLPVEVGEELNTKEFISILDWYIAEQMKLRDKAAKKFNALFLEESNALKEINTGV